MDFKIEISDSEPCLQLLNYQSCGSDSLLVRYYCNDGYNRMPVTLNNWPWLSASNPVSHKALIIMRKLSFSKQKFFKKIFLFSLFLSQKQDLTSIFHASRPVRRGDDGTLTIFQDRLINIFKAAIQNVSNTEIDDSRKDLYERLKEKTKELREMDIESPWRRNIQPGQRSDEVIDKCVCPNLANKDPRYVQD